MREVPSRAPGIGRAALGVPRSPTAGLPLPSGGIPSHLKTPVCVSIAIFGSMSIKRRDSGQDWEQNKSRGLT